MRQSPAQRPPDVTVFGMILGFVLQMVLAILLGWLFSVGLGLAVLFLLKSKVVLLYGVSLLQHQMAEIRQYAPAWCAVAAQQCLQTLQQTLTVKTQITQWLSVRKILWLEHYLQASYPWVSDITWTVLLLTQLAAIKVCRVLATIPLFLLLGSVAFLDGLVERDLRKWGFGRESALLYHRARRYIPYSLLVSVVIYLALPISLAPTKLFVLASIVFALAVFLTARSFKKYI